MLNPARRSGEQENERRTALERADIAVQDPALPSSHAREVDGRGRCHRFVIRSLDDTESDETRDYAVITTAAMTSARSSMLRGDWHRQAFTRATRAISSVPDPGGIESADFIDEAKHRLFVQNERSRTRSSSSAWSERRDAA